MAPTARVSLMPPAARVILLLTVVMGYACFSHAGVTPVEWGFCMAAVTLVACVWFPFGLRAAPLPHPVFTAALFLVPAVAAIQLLPLPEALLRAIDPARADLLAGWNGLGIGRTDWAPLSVAPSLTFAQLERLLTCLLTFFLARECSASLAEKKWWVAAPPVAVAVLEGLLGLWQYVLGMGRAYGTYVNPNHFAALMHMALPLAAMGTAAALRKSRRTGTAHIAAACGLMACAAVAIFGTLFSLSRMGLAAMLAGFAVMGFLAVRRGRGMLLAAVPVVLMAVVLTAPGALADRIAAGGAELSGGARLEFARETLRLIAAYPWFGCGLGTYVSAIQQFRASAPTALLDFAHNDYLQLAAELGIVGLAPPALAGGWIFTRPWVAARSALRSRDRYLAVACAASLTALALDCAVDFDFYIPANMLVAAWIAGVGSYFEPRREVPMAMSS